jgi:hypothetical protein
MDSKPASPEFVKLERELEEAVLKLKQAQDPNLRRELLRNMRLLLQEADRLVDSGVD